MALLPGDSIVASIKGVVFSGTILHNDDITPPPKEGDLLVAITEVFTVRKKSPDIKTDRLIFVSPSQIQQHFPREENGFKPEFVITISDGEVYDIKRTDGKHISASFKIEDNDHDEVYLVKVNCSGIEEA